MQFKIKLKCLSKENCFRVGAWQCQQNELDKVLTADCKPRGIVWLHTRAATRVVSACVGRDRWLMMDYMCFRALKQDDNTRLMWVLIVMAPLTYMPKSLTEQHELGRCTVACPRWKCAGVSDVGCTRPTGPSFHSAAGCWCGSNSRRRWCTAISWLQAGWHQSVDTSVHTRVIHIQMRMQAMVVHTV